MSITEPGIGHRGDSRLCQAQGKGRIDIHGTGYLHGCPGVQMKVPSRVLSSQDRAQMCKVCVMEGLG